MFEKSPAEADLAVKNKNGFRFMKGFQIPSRQALDGPYLVLSSRKAKELFLAGDNYRPDYKDYRRVLELAPMILDDKEIPLLDFVRVRSTSSVSVVFFLRALFVFFPISFYLFIITIITAQWRPRGEGGRQGGMYLSDFYVGGWHPIKTLALKDIYGWGNGVSNE